MYLTKKQADKFYHLFYSLLIYANEQFFIVDEFFERGTAKLSPEKIHKVASFVWASDHIIDDFVKDNPQDLGFDDLRTVREWRDHVTGYFYMAEHREAYTVLLMDDFAFGVIGISHDIDELYPQLPVGVETTLLPFEGHIIYDMNFRYFPVSFGPNISKKIKTDLKTFTKAGTIVSDTKTFIETAKKISDQVLKEKRGESSSEKDLFSAEKTGEVLQGAHGPAADVHKGVLSGLSYGEREEAIRNYMMESYGGIMKEDFYESARDAAYRHRPERSLFACLSLLPKDKLKDLLNNCQLRLTSGARKTEYAEALTKVLPDSIFTTWVFESNNLAQTEALCELADAGGQLTFSEDDMQSVLGFHWFMPPFVMTFHHENTYTAVMPDEIREVFVRSRESLLEKVLLKNEICRFANALVEIYGVVSIRETLRIWGESDNAQMDDESFVELLFEIEYSPLGDFQTYDHDGEIYLTHYLLDPDDDNFEDEFDDDEDFDFDFDEEDFEEEFGDEDNSDEDEYFSDTEFIEYILSRQTVIPGKPIPYAELLQYADAATINNLPAMAKLRTFFDANIPADSDDYFFADKTIEELLKMFRFDVSLHDIVDYLIHAGLEFDIDKMNAMLAFVSDAANNVPKWTNHGWTSSELFEKRKNDPSFCAADAGIDDLTEVAQPAKSQKTGRNDPCPCGSGKKYKNCCGKVLN